MQGMSADAAAFPRHGVDHADQGNDGPILCDCAAEHEGAAELEFELPDFVGRGRLMTIVWTDQGRMGAASGPDHLRPGGR